MVKILHDENATNYTNMSRDKNPQVTVYTYIYIYNLYTYSNNLLFKKWKLIPDKLCRSF